VDAAESGRDASGWAVVTFARVARQLTTSSRTAGLPVTRRSPVQAPFPASRLDPSPHPVLSLRTSHPARHHYPQTRSRRGSGPILCTSLGFESRPVGRVKGAAVPPLRFTVLCVSGGVYREVTRPIVSHARAAGSGDRAHRKNVVPSILSEKLLAWFQLRPTPHVAEIRGGSVGGV